MSTYLIQRLEHHVAMGDRSGYWQVLADAGDEYAAWALAGVDNLEFRGRLANNYAEAVATKDAADWERLGQDLIARDFRARERSFEDGDGLHLGYDAIQRYHEAAYRDAEIPLSAWFAATPMWNAEYWRAPSPVKDIITYGDRIEDARWLTERIEGGLKGAFDFLWNLVSTLAGVAAPQASGDAAVNDRWSDILTASNELSINPDDFSAFDFVGEVKEIVDDLAQGRLQLTDALGLLDAAGISGLSDEVVIGDLAYSLIHFLIGDVVYRIEQQQPDLIDNAPESVRLLWSRLPSIDVTTLPTHEELRLDEQIGLWLNNIGGPLWSAHTGDYPERHLISVEAGSGDRPTFKGGTDGGEIISMASGGGTAQGHDGDEELRGSDDADHLYGGKGDDVLIGNGGPDLLVGGVRNDAQKAYHAEDGIDTADYSDAPGGITIEVGEGRDWLTRDWAGNAEIIVSAFAN